MALRSWWRWWRRRPWSRRKGSAAERRRAQRHLCTLDTSGRLVASLAGNTQIVRVRNISASGISLVLNGPVEPETTLYIELLNRPSSYLCMLRLRVVYSVEHPNGLFIVGGAFLQRLNAEQLTGLLS
jgi:hypothetical protein